MTNRSDVVDRFMTALDHPLKAGVGHLRLAILSSDERITEHIKWNAPSFCFAGEDRVTFRLRPGDQVQLVFHTGAKVRPDGGAVTIEDVAGLLDWKAHDRAVVTLHDMRELETHEAAVVELVGRWMASSHLRRGGER